jgi:hypothetical protein
VSEATHLRVSADSDVPVCWMKNSRITGAKFTENSVESDCADCTDIKAALDEVDAAAAELGEGFSGIKGFFDEYGK